MGWAWDDMWNATTSTVSTAWDWTIASQLWPDDFSWDDPEYSGIAPGTSTVPKPLQGSVTPRGPQDGAFPLSDDQLNAKNDYMWQHGQEALKTLALRPIRFNAPLHPSMRGKSPYAAKHRQGDLRAEWKTGRKPWNWRLGQIVADAASSAYQDGEYRYGFRFLYNPSAIDFSTPLTVGYSPTALNNSGGAQSMAPTGRLSLELMLNRIPDVTIPTGDYDIPGNNDSQDIKDIRQRGTMYDIDYLYRAANGVWMMPDAIEATNKRDEKKKKGDKKKGKKEPDYVGKGKGWPYESGDIGMLLPTSMWLSIGKTMRYYGWIESISYTHELFSSDMVPILTRVGLSFQRLLIGSKKDFEALTESSAVSRNSYGEYFDVGAAVGASAPAPGSSSGAKGYPHKKGSESNPEYLWFSFLNKGFTKASAAGILGNLEQEAGADMDPEIQQPGGPGRGIAQWSEGQRWETCVSWCKSKGLDPESIEGQAGYLLNELAGGDWGDIQRYKKFNDPVEAAVYFHDTFEKSADSDSAVRSVRGGNAKKWYKKFKDLDNTPASDGGGTGQWSRGTRVHVVGDSLTVGCESAIKARYRNKGAKITVDAKTSRSTADAVSLFDNSDARAANILVVALGTNDYWDAGQFKANARRIMRKINSSTQVFWINVRLQNHLSSSRDINDALSDLSQDFGNLYIIDYYSRVEDRFFAGDGVHLTGSGYQWRTGLYVKSVVGGGLSGRVGN